MLRWLAQIVAASVVAGIVTVAMWLVVFDAILAQMDERDPPPPPPTIVQPEPFNAPHWMQRRLAEIPTERVRK